LGFAGEDARDHDEMLPGYAAAAILSLPRLPNLATIASSWTFWARAIGLPSAMKTSSTPSNQPRPSSSTTRNQYFSVVTMPSAKDFFGDRTPVLYD